ncbi:hypothetical protein [Brevibacillus sp. NRS-1366]|uniref:hypothetical protein n=1 Tax=Brevibacillus sp. NRS-1366 TaxID=3233899 RepID=UPI003D1D3600
MQNKINDLINSESDNLKKIGWFLFDRNNGQDGLTSDELELLLDMLHFKNADDQFYKEQEEGFHEGYTIGYGKGWEDKVSHYRYDNTPTYVCK